MYVLFRESELGIVCNHVLHKKCLERFKKSTLEFNCPICREKIINYTKIDR